MSHKIVIFTSSTPCFVRNRCCWQIVLFVNFIKDKFIPVVWRLTIPIFGHETSRREQVRRHEELAQRERALRETHVKSIHEVEELERAQEMRIDEFSRHELRESEATFQELTSQKQELQDRVNFMNDSREFQDVESICSGKLSHVPSQPASVPSPCGMLSRDQSLRPDTWNLLGTLGNVFGSSLRQSVAEFLG